MLNVGHSQEQDYLQERLADPKTVAALTALVDKLPDLKVLLDMLTGLLQRGPEMADTINEGVEQFRELTPEQPPVNIAGLLATVVKFQTIIDSPETQALLDSDIFKPKTISVVNKAADALIDSIDNYDPEKKVGLLGLVAVLTDPDVKRAINFLTSFLKQFGKELAK
ncbi:MAG: DUF1641 domain-containing protein [Deinococcota bacterium]